MVTLSSSLRRLIDENRAGIDATTSNFREFSSQMTRLVDRIDRLVAANQGNVTDTVTNAKELSAKLQATIDNMNAITGKINSGQGSVGQLVTNDETTKNLNDALVAVKEGVNSVTGAMTEVKKLNFDLGIREEYLTGPGKGKGYSTRGHPAHGPPALLPLRALEPAAGPEAGVDRDPDDHVFRRPHRGRPRGRDDVQEQGRPFPRRSAIGWGAGSAAPASSRARAALASTTSRSRTGCASRPRCSTSAARTTTRTAS